MFLSLPYKEIWYESISLVVVRLIPHPPRIICPGTNPRLDHRHLPNGESRRFRRPGKRWLHLGHPVDDPKGEVTEWEIAYALLIEDRTVGGIGIVRARALDNPQPGVAQYAAQADIWAVDGSEQPTVQIGTMTSNWLTGPISGYKGGQIITERTFRERSPEW